jgi:hypothetical protein
MTAGPTQHRQDVQSFLMGGNHPRADAIQEGGASILLPGLDALLPGRVQYEAALRVDLEAVSIPQQTQEAGFLLA